MQHVRAYPQRIVSLLPAATEILCFLGAADRIVGISHQCRTTAELAGKPRVTFSPLKTDALSVQIDVQVRERTARGESLYLIDEAALAALKPQVIVTQAQCDVCAVRYDDVVAAAQRIDPSGEIKIVALKPATFSDIWEDIVAVADAVGDGHVAGRLKLLRDRLDAVRRKVGPIPPEQRPRVTVIEWIDPLMIAANWTPELVELAGGQYGLAQAGRHSQCVAWDEVKRYDPQVLLVAPCGFELARTVEESQQLANLPGWQELSAVRDGRVWALDGDVHINCPSPGVVDTLELVAHLLNPKEVPAPASVRETWRHLSG
jgi:iron complex transport system substrate-binding protein